MLAATRRRPAPPATSPRRRCRRPGTWSAGGESGAFTYSYPVSVPPVPGGLEPKVALGYDSQSVDGLTSSTNNQASWVGDGWDYSPAPSSEATVMRAEHRHGATRPATSATPPNAVTTLSLGGQETTLVRTPTGAWHAEADNGEKIAYDITGSTSNGTYDGDYWVITDPTARVLLRDERAARLHVRGRDDEQRVDAAGVLHRLGPAVLQAPRSPTPSAPWRGGGTSTTSPTPHGDAIAYFYNTRDELLRAATTARPRTPSYIQGGDLTKIEYGLRAGSIYGERPPPPR